MNMIRIRIPDEPQAGVGFLRFSRPLASGTDGTNLKSDGVTVLHGSIGGFAGTAESL
jgi:hypothetical protein